MRVKKNTFLVLLSKTDISRNVTENGRYIALKFYEICNPTMVKSKPRLTERGHP